MLKPERALTFESMDTSTSEMDPRAEFPRRSHNTPGQMKPRKEPASAFRATTSEASAISHMPQLCTQCANACQGALGPMKRVICPIKIRNELPHIVAS